MTATEQPLGALDGAWVREQCLDLERTVRRFTKAEDVDAVRPGAPGNIDTSERGWLYFYGQLHGMMAVGYRTPELPRLTARDHADLRAALHEEPKYVQLLSGQTVGVFPKGSFALDRLFVINAYLAWLVPQRLVLSQMLDQWELLQHAVAAQSQLEAQFIWIATHPGPGVPWTDFSQWEHQAPPWCYEVGGHDLTLLHDAFQEVNQRRSQVISARTHALAGRTQQDEMTVDTFNAIMAAELGISTRELAEQWSQPMVYAMAHEKMLATQRAEARAKQDAS